MKIDVTRPGFAFSVLGHLALLAVVVSSFSLCSVLSVFSFVLPNSVLAQVCSATLVDDNMPEAVPIETITQNDFNQIMKGEKSSKDVTKEPTTKADKLAELDEQHALPPNPEAQRDTPPPPPPKPAAPTPPVPTPPVPTPPVPPPPAPPPPPVPEPPQRPEPKPPAPTPPLPPDVPPPPKPEPRPVPKPAPVKSAPPAPVPPERDPDAEVIKQAPPPPPKPVPTPPKPPEHQRAEVKPPPVPAKPAPTPPVPQPAPPKLAEKAPPAPPKPDRPAPKKPDQLAKLVEQTQDDADPTPEPAPKPAPKAKPAPHARPAPAPRQTAAADSTAAPSDNRAFDPTDISKMLNAQPAGAPPSTGKTLSKTASRGATSGNAPKMSPSQSDALDGLLADQFKQCWSYLGLDHGRYIPEIKVAYAEDGSLQSEPQLLNRPSDPNARSLAESALRAVRQCNPLHIPAQFAPFYEQWRSRILRFDPAEMSG